MRSALFLQNIQELIQGEQELADAVKDLSSLSVLEEAESRESESVLAYSNANLGDLEALVKEFFTAVPIPFLFAAPTLHESVEYKRLIAANKETGYRHVVSLILWTCLQ